MKKILNLLVVGALISVFTVSIGLVGCKIATAAEKIPFGPGDPNITGHIIFQTYKLQDEIIKLSMAEINKYYPNITYELNLQESGALFGTMPAIVDAEEYFDISAAWTGTGVYGYDFFTDKYCYELTPWYEKYGWEEKYAYPEALSAYKTVDKWYCIVKEMALEWPNIYNKAIFDEAGIEYPDPLVAPTLEEFNMICDKIKAAGYYPFALGLSNKWKTNTMLSWAISRSVPEAKYLEYLHYTDPNYTPTVKWTDEAVINGLNVIADWAKKEYFIPGCITIDSFGAIELFAAKKAAMLGAELWTLPSIQEAATTGGFELGSFQLPTIVEGMPKGHAAYVNQGHFVPRYVKEENLPAIETYFDFIFSEAGQLILRQPQFNLFPITNIPMEQYKDTLEPFGAASLEYAQKNGIYDQTTVFVHAELSDLINTTIQEIVNKKGAVDTAQLAQKLQDKADELRLELSE